MILETFLPHLFFEKSKPLTPTLGTLITMPVNKYVLGLMNPVSSANKNYLILQRKSIELIQAVMGEGAFFNYGHRLFLREEMCDG